MRKMSISYNQLWKLLIDKRMKKMDLMNSANIGTTTLTKLGKNQQVRMEVLIKISRVLDSNIGDIVEVVSDEK